MGNNGPALETFIEVRAQTSDSIRGDRILSLSRPRDQVLETKIFTPATVRRVVGVCESV